MILGTLIIWWNLVAATCPPGGVLSGPIHYDVRWNVRYPLQWVDGPPDENGDITIMPVYNDFAWTGDSTFAPPVDTGESDLMPGEILTYEVTAVDGLGRRDCGLVPGG
jgi:hypothetical protein